MYGEFYLSLPRLYTPWQEGMSAMCRGTRLQRKTFPKLGLCFAACNKAGKLLWATTSTFTVTLLPHYLLHAAPLLFMCAHSWGAAAEILLLAWVPGCAHPPQRGGDQLLLSLHTSLSHTAPGRINRFHCCKFCLLTFPQSFADSLPLGGKGN